MKELRKKLAALLMELKKIQDDHKGIAMPEAVAKRHDDIVTEAKGMQDDLDRREAGVATMERSKKVMDPSLPDDDQPADEGKSATAQLEAKRQKIVGYVTLGAFVTAQKALDNFRRLGMPNSQFKLVDVPDLHRKMIGLNAEQLAEFKAVPTLGDGVIEPERLPDIVRVAEQDRLRLRDVLNVSQTTSDAVKYTRIVGFTRAAASVTTGEPKPQAALELDSRTAPVSTIAVWIPVQNQQMEDLPALQNIINTELLYDLGKHEEELIMYGSGSGEEFLGILNDPDVLTARNQGGDTLIDVTRRAITDVILAGYQPNAVLVDPLDWESIVLLKGSDLRYIVQVLVSDEGAPRLWGVPVIESVAMRDFAGANPEERNLLVGDFIRGATLWDRQRAAISVGWINDQFIRNQRTLLAEERAAFAVRRPLAFRKYVTQVASAS